VSRRATAERFVAVMNAFDGDAIDALLGPGFEFEIGSHTSDREDFLAGLATGPGADPSFRFEPLAYEEEDGAVTIAGSQVYRWRKSGEIAFATEQSLRLDFDGGLVVRATVSPVA
jgi:Domain of unknown function (DUF4440)